MHTNSNKSANNERQQAIQNILLHLNDIDSLKRLFCGELNYDYSGDPLSIREWPENVKESLAEDPILIARR